MCVRVIRRVVNCRWIINSLYCDTAQYQSSLYKHLLCRMYFNFAIRQSRINCYHVIFCEHYTAVNFDVCFVTIAYPKTLKLYLSSKHVTQSYLSLPSAVYNCDNQYSYVPTQWHCTVRCYWKVKHDTQNSCYFNALLYLTPSLLTECESTTVPYNSNNTYSSSCYSQAHPSYWCYVFDGCQLHALAALSPVPVE
jgi:hypothetical protein